MLCAILHFSIAVDDRFNVGFGIILRPIAKLLLSSCRLLCGCCCASFFSLWFFSEMIYAYVISLLLLFFSSLVLSWLGIDQLVIAYSKGYSDSCADLLYDES